MKREEADKIFHQWLNKNYGDTHPSRLFMKSAWLSGYSYAKAELAIQEDKSQADRQELLAALEAIADEKGPANFTVLEMKQIARNAIEEHKAARS